MGRAFSGLTDYLRCINSLVAAALITMLSFTSALVLAQSEVSPEAQAELTEAIGNFAEVKPGLYRGMQPTDDGLRALQQAGIHTIVNFRHEEDHIAEEAALVQELGMRYESLPWRIQRLADPQIIRDFFTIIDDASAYPIFFHCRRGTERTGVVAALYFMQYEGLSRAAAYAKAFDDFPLRWIWKGSVKRQLDHLTQRLHLDE